MTLLLLLRPHGGVVVPPPPYSNPVPFAWDTAGDTPDELEQRLAFTTVLCRSTGEPVDILDRLASRKLTQQLNLPTSYEITMRMDDESYPFALLEQQPRLKVYRVSTPAELAIDPLTVNQLVFYGTLPSQGIEEDAQSGFAKMTFQDPMWVLNQRNVVSVTTFTNTDQGLILWNIINAQNARTNGDTWIRQGGTTTGTLRDRTYDAGKEVAGLIQDMTQVDGGCDVSLTPVDYWSIDGTRVMGLFNAHTERGADKRDQEFVYAATIDDGTAGGLHGNVGNMKRTRAKVVTSATSVGSADTQTFQNTTSSFGLLEDFETFSDVSISQTLLDKSVGKVGNAQNAPMILEITDPTREAPQPILDYNLGDTVYATCRRGGMEFYSLPVRVHGIDITITQDGVIQTKPTLASLPSTIISPTLPPGGGVPSAPPPPGAERCGPPISADGGAGYTKPSGVIVHGEDAYARNPSGTLYGGIEGLTVGQSYTISTWTRGTGNALTGSGTAWYFKALHPSTTVLATSTDQSLRIWNATLGTRTTDTLVSVTFVSTGTTGSWGIQVTQTDASDTYFTLPTIVPA